MTHNLQTTITEITHILGIGFWSQATVATE